MNKETKTEYRWGDESIIRRIEVREQRNGHAIAYVYADLKPDAFPARQNIRSVLRLHGLGTASDFRNDQFGLRVSGLKSGEELISLLTRAGLVTQPTTVNTSQVDEPKPATFIDAVRANSLRAAGMFYSLGNLVYLSSGLLRSKERGKTDYGQISSALIWGSGDILIAAVGGRDDSRQFTSLLTKLKDHYAKEGIEVPKNATLFVETSTAQKSLGSRAYDFVHSHVNPIKCATEVVAAFGYYKAGKAQGNVWKQRTAVTFGLGFFASLVIPEKKIDNEKYAEAGPLGRLWMKIQSNPLSVGGISGYSNTVLTTVGAYKEGQLYKQAQSGAPMPSGIAPSKYYKLDYAAPAVMLFGNSLYAISKKNTGGDIKAQETISDVYIVAAQILNKQPDNIRQAAIDSTVKFLGERPEIKDTREQIEVRLKKEMATQKQNPWFEPVGLPTYVPTPKTRFPKLSREPARQIQTEGLEHAKADTQQLAVSQR